MRGAAAGGLLLGVFYGVEEPLHPGFFTGRGIFFDDALSGGGIDLLDHVFKRRLGFPHLFFLGQKDKFFDAGPDRAFCRLVPEPAAFTLPVTFFRRTAFTCQKITLHGAAPSELRAGPQYLFKIRRSAFHPFAFAAFGNVLYLAVFKKGLHLDLAAAGTKEFLRGAGRTRVFTGLGHFPVSLPLMFYLR
jgi:hypothetical protein